MAGPGTNNNLSVQSLINIQVVLTPNAAQAPNVNTAMIVGPSSVIDVVQRFRTYASLPGVATDFGTVAPEYKAAALYFAQVPQPNQLYVGRWAQNATPAILYCGVLTTAQQALSNWTGIVAGSFKIAINGGGAVNIPSLNFSGAVSMTNIASIISTALTTATVAATCTWNGSEFVFTTTATGTAATIVALTAGTSNDISGQLMGTAATLNYIANGINAETPVAAATIIDGMVFSYFFTFAVTTAGDITDAQFQAIAAYIEGASNKHIHGISSANVNCISGASTTDVAYLIGPNGSNYNRSFVQYSSDPINGPYVAASWIGRAVTVPFNASNSVIAMMYKTEPGVTPEALTPTQWSALAAKNGNAYVTYNNATSILQNGTMGSGQFFDLIQDIDWLAYAIQTNVFNLLYTTPTKVPQTDAGMAMFGNVIDATCAQAVANGTLAPGVWTVAGFGQLAQNGYVSKGYYVYAPPISTQAPSDRAARKSVPFQIAAKFAGAVQNVNITVYVNQ